MSKRRNADPNPDPNAPSSTDPNDRIDDSAAENDGDDTPGDDDEDDASAAAAHERLDQHEEVGLDLRQRLEHVEDILDKIMAAGHVYARAGEDHAKLRESIASRETVAGS